MRNKKILNWYWSGGAAQAFDSPDLYYDNLYKDQVILHWSEGADSYVVDISDDSGFSNIVDTYSGSLSTKTFTGLTADTRYWVRCKAQFSGYSDSDYREVDFYTMPSSIVAAYLPMGGKLNDDTDFATINASSSITALKSVIASGPTFTRTAGTFTADNYQVDDAYNAGNLAGGGYLDSVSDVDMGNGAFSIVIRFKASTPGGASILFCDAPAGGVVRRIYFSGLTTCTVVINSSFSTAMTFATPWVANRYLDFVLTCDGSTMRASVDGGATWSNIVTRPGSGSVNKFNRIGATPTGGNAMQITFTKMFFSNTELTSSQITRLLSIEKNQSWTNVGVDVLKQPKNLPSTYVTDPVNNYLTAFAGAGVSRSYQRIFSITGYDFFALDAPSAAPDYNNTTLFIRNRSNGKIYTGINMGHYATTEDVHERPTMNLINNTVWFAQMNAHYDFINTIPGTLFIRKFWENFNFIEYTTLPKAKRLGDGYCLNQTQYHQLAGINGGSILASFSQRRDPLIPLPDRIMCALSYDGGQSWSEEFPIIDTDTAANWVYPFVLYNGNRSEVYLAVTNVITGGSPNPRTAGIWLLKTSDFKTWSNIAETYNKTVKTGEVQTPLSMTELYANMTLIDARSATATAFNNGMCTTDGMLYGVVGKGDNTTYQLWYQIDAGTLVKKDISFSPDTVMAGSSVTDLGTYASAYHTRPACAVYKGSGKFYVVANQVNGGNWLPTLYETLDWGDTWAKAGTLPNIDNTKQHLNLEISANYHFNGDKGTFMCNRLSAADASTDYILDVDEFDNI